MKWEGPAVGDKHPLALAMRPKVLPKNEKTRKYWTLAADALFGQNTIVIEILYNNAIGTAISTINRAAALVVQSKVIGKQAAVGFQIIRENDQPASVAMPSFKRSKHTRSSTNLQVAECLI